MVSLPFRRVLIANRGEIAVRVIRACREAGLQTVAVYSAADTDAPHTRLADAAYELGPAPAAESYLSIERILAVAQRAGADAVHPGYGFLSENPAFAEACASVGLTWIGPPPGAMRLLGDKAAARRLARAEGVAIVPGYDGADQEEPTLADQAERIGFPLLVKAAAGGGGRGMRVVRGSDELSDALAGARREATAAFSDGRLLLERLVEPARHVEVQVLADLHGNVVHLGERDCSVQRRHQKVIEESPSPAVTPALRAVLGEAAVRVARAAGYVNAGTCEFLLDAEGQFFFIEMNARLQVEHPVTELVAGLDLVRQQLRIAAGEPLGFDQDDVMLRGHAIECRLYAEDPARDFLPSTGILSRLVLPLGAGLRHDLGVAEGNAVTPYYDAMLGKLIVHGEDRATAIARTRVALEQYRVEGVATNLQLLRWALGHPELVAGDVTTDFLAREWRPPPPSDVSPEALAAAAGYEVETARAGATGDPWGSVGPWRVAGQGIPLALVVDGRRHSVVASRADEPDAWLVDVGGQPYRLTLRGEEALVSLAAGTGSPILAPGSPSMVRIARWGDGIMVTCNGIDYLVRLAPPPAAEATAGERHFAGGPAELRAPMPGRVVRVAVEPGDRVAAHQALVVLEAMKIEHAVAAPRAATVTAVHCRAGDAVDGGALLVELAGDDGAASPDAPGS